MKELEKENQRLRKAVSDLTLDKLILQVSSPHFMYQFDLESLERVDAYSGTDAVLCDCTV